MSMNLGELIAMLQEMQKIAPDNTSVNVESVRLKGNISTMNDSLYGGYSRDEKRSRSLTVWLESYADGPSAPICPDPSAHYVQRFETDAQSMQGPGPCQWSPTSNCVLQRGHNGPHSV
jgi:hypothetical protein